MAITETNDHNTPLLTTDGALPRNDNLEIDRRPPNDGLCHTLEIVLPPLNRHPETPAHPVPSPKRCNSRQEQSPLRTTPYLNQF